MSKNYIEYKLVVERFSISEELKISTFYQGITEIVILQEKDNDTVYTKIRFYLDSNVVDDKSAKEYCQYALSNVLAVLAWNTDGYVGIPTVEAISINGVTSAYNDLCCSFSVPTNRSVLSNIKSSLEQSPCISEYYKLYRFSLLSKDCISRFIILYSILALLKGNQDAIDNYIKSKEPDVSMEYNEFKEKNQTIYTFLRNRISHTQKQTDLQEVRERAGNIIEKFSKLVKEAIMGHLGQT